MRIRKSLSILISILLLFLLTTCSIFSGGQKADIIVKSHKSLTSRNPLMTHTFGADPNVLVYGGRVYIYMTGDTLEYDHYLEIKSNSYSTINTLRVISSEDLVNWTYHEPIKAAGDDGIAEWAARSWAPAIVCKEVSGKDKFFLYFSNNANGIGVLTADSPLGPWEDEIGKALINRQTPNCSDVPWLFDPAVFIDDDGRAYMYFGGGVPKGKEDDPGSARVVELNSDMISLAGNPIKIDIPFFFEAIEMNKINGRYILSYCTNWSITDEAKNRFGIDRAVIAIMSGNNPRGPFTMERTIFKNPGTFFGVWGNNHHDIFEFKGQWYMAYHSQLIEQALDINGKGYRSPHIDTVRMKNGMFESVTGTKKGVEQVGKLNPYISHQGATSAVSAEISFGSHSPKYSFEYASALKQGSWLGIIGADFGNIGAKSITMLARSGNKKHGTVEIRLDSPQGEIIGVCSAKPSRHDEYTINLKKTVIGIHDVFFVFDIDFELGAWHFNK
jgi:arabinoxylan arabinofuranohydrolase